MSPRYAILFSATSGDETGGPNSLDKFVNARLNDARLVLSFLADSGCSALVTILFATDVTGNARGSCKTFLAVDEVDEVTVVPLTGRVCGDEEGALVSESSSLAPLSSSKLPGGAIRVDVDVSSTVPGTREDVCSLPFSDPCSEKRVRNLETVDLDWEDDCSEKAETNSEDRGVLGIITDATSASSCIASCSCSSST